MKEINLELFTRSQVIPSMYVFCFLISKQIFKEMKCGI